MYAKRVDSNQKEIIKAFKELGCSVFDLSKVGQGLPDLLIGKNHKTILVEIKSSEKAKFTQPQIDFMKNWKGSAVARAQDLDGVLTIVRFLDKT